jgi:hypothetical protein
MNWDAAIEAVVHELDGTEGVDYLCDARAVELQSDRVSLKRISRSPILTLTKLHGSINWLYCDNCQQLFWCRPAEASRIASLILSDRDWEILNELAEIDRDSERLQRVCPQCRGESLSTRVATFSFRKALDFPMFRKSWDAAERILAHAETWTFIGYSLPQADFEFKHLLKRVQLARRKAPLIRVVTGGSREAIKATKENYRRLFGRALGEVFEAGLQDGILSGLSR